MSEKEKRETLEAFAALPEETRRGFAAGYACAMGVAETQAHAQEQEEQDQQPPA